MGFWRVCAGLRLSACVLAFAACIAFPVSASARRVPELKLKNLQGQAQKLSALRGHIVVLNFWATWCGPCQEELPRLSKMAQEWAGKNVDFVAVSIDEHKDQAKIAPMLERLHVPSAANFDIWIGSNSDTLSDFGLGDIVPGTAVIDTDGTIVTRIMGEARNDDVQAAVNWLLGGRVGTPPPALVKRY
jgi:thiol-disulfide isomerase/thioredoxin